MIDAMSLAEAEEIFAYWADNPPPHLMLQTIAAMLGWKPRRSGGLADLTAAPPPGLRVATNAGAMPAPIFDIAELRARNRSRA